MTVESRHYYNTDTVRVKFTANSSDQTFAAVKMGRRHGAATTAATVSSLSATVAATDAAKVATTMHRYDCVVY